MISENLDAIIASALNRFETTGTVKSCVPYGNGHINDTFCITCERQGKPDCKYIMQAVNRGVFEAPERVMRNIELVTGHLRRKTTDDRGVLQLVPTHDGVSFFEDEWGNFWRMYAFIEDSVCIEHPERAEDFFECGVAFGAFQRDLSDFPADSLYEVLPHFHDTVGRYRQLENAVMENRAGRLQGVARELAFIRERSDFYGLLAEAHQNGLLPLRVSHNDTKSNNVLLDATTHRALCVIDLDTVMPGFSVTDFGDAIRFGANTAAEDEPDVSKVGLNLPLFEAYTDGFLQGCNGQLLDSEIMLLPEGAKMMTIECGIRFLTDYLAGDTYFKTQYPEHNLVRCRTQLKLVSDMEAHWAEMKQTVRKYCKLG